MSTKPEIRIVEDPQELAQVAAAEFKKQANKAAQSKGSFNISLSGGSTPKAMFDLLSSEARPDSDLWRTTIPWSKTHFFWGDERHVPPEDEESNYRMTQEHLLSKILTLPENIHRIETENPDAQEVAAKYEQDLRQHFNLSGSETPQFDLVFLGMGDDGHTASLFPGTDAVHDSENLIAAPWVEKFNSHRITLTPPVINNADRVIFLVKGEDKAEALVQVIEGEKNEDLYPAQIISPTHGSLLWIIDRAAASKLSQNVDRSGLKSY